MEPVVILSILGGIIILLLFSGAPLKPVRFVGQSIIKLLIGAILLFFLNIVGERYGVHVPINFATSAVSGFLGIPGMLALTAIQKWVLFS